MHIRKAYSDDDEKLFVVGYTSPDSHRVWYARELPGEDGVDWGWVDSFRLARRLGKYWKTRCVANLQALGYKPQVTEVERGA